MENRTINPTPRQLTLLAIIGIMIAIVCAFVLLQAPSTNQAMEVSGVDIMTYNPIAMLKQFSVRIGLSLLN